MFAVSGLHSGDDRWQKLLSEKQARHSCSHLSDLNRREDWQLLKSRYKEKGANVPEGYIKK